MAYIFVNKFDFLLIKKFGQPSWFFPQSFYQKNESLENYKRFIVNSLKLLNSTNTNLDEDVNQMVDLEKRLAKVCFFIFVVFVSHAALFIS